MSNSGWFKKGHIGYRKGQGKGKKQTQLDYLNRHPWIKPYIHILTRCNIDKNSSYFGRVKNFLTKLDIKTLWFRDQAFLLCKPSIDRIDTNGNYTFGNCRFIELEENLRRKKGGR